MMHDGKDHIIEALKAANEAKDRMIAALMDDLEDRNAKLCRIKLKMQSLQRWVDVLTEKIWLERQEN